MTVEPAYVALEHAVAVLPDRPLLIALRWTGEGAQAPATVEARTDAGQTLSLPVRLLGVSPRRPAEETALRYQHWRWAHPPYEMTELPADSAAAPAARLLVLDDPQSWPGTGINIGLDRIRLFPVRPDEFEASSAPLSDSTGFDEPDPVSPVAAVRRALWRRCVNPNVGSAPWDETSLTSMLARQTSGRWFAALRDLALIDPALERDLESLLVRTAWDGSTRFAAWPGDTINIIELESILMSRFTDEPGDEAWRLRIQSWMMRQPEAVPWIESDAGLPVRMRCANLTTSPQRARVSFADRPGLVGAIDLAPTSVGRLLVNRPTESPPSRLIVQGAGTTRALPLLQPESVVLPPALAFAGLWQSWTLDRWLAGEALPEEASHCTSLLMRRSPQTQQWQIDIRCAIAAPLTQSDPAGRSPLDALGHWYELTGHESITVFIGPFDQPIIAATILPDGSVRDWQRSALLSPDLVSVSRDASHWEATLTLPGVLASEPQLEVGLIRMYAGSDAVGCFPRPALPWRHDPGRIRLDLSRWDALPLMAPPTAAPTPSPTPSTAPADEPASEPASEPDDSTGG